MADDREEVTKKLNLMETTLTGIFENRLSKIAESDTRRIAVSNTLNNENEFVAKDPNSAIIRFIIRIWKTTNNNFILFLRSLRMKKNQLQIFESELSKRILIELKRTETEFGSEDNKDNFNKLIDIYLNVVTNPEMDYIVGYIKTPPHRAELESAINNIRNGKIAKRIREVIIALTNEETDYLMRYLNEVISWNSKEAITEDIQFFTAKSSSFLYGRGEQYRGLFTYFKDEKLEQTLKLNPAYLQLIKYNLQLLYLKRLRNKISTYQTGDWTQFEEVYNNVKKIAGTFVREFGNTEIASELFAEKKEIREYPERWLMDIDNKIAEISSTQYRRIKVIIPFIKEMERIFNSRIDELRSMAKPEIAHLKDALLPLIKLEKDIAENVIREIKKSRKVLKERLKKLKMEFDTIENECIDAMTDFIIAKTSIVDSMNEELAARRQRLIAFAKNEDEHAQFVGKIIGDDAESAVMDIKRMFAALYSLDKAYKAGIGISNNLRSMVSLFTKRGVLKQIETLSKNLATAEKAYGKLDEFILTKLGFLVTQNEARKEEEYGRTRTTASR